jgi:CheY-like chemotaxis protein
MNGKPIEILLIEDAPDDVLLIRKLLAETDSIPFNLRHADQLSTGLERLTMRGIKVIPLDLSLPDVQGLGTFLKLHDITEHRQTEDTLKTSADQ